MLYSYSLFAKVRKSGAEYNIKLIGLPTNYFKLSAAIIGISSAVISILIVIVFDQNVMIVIVMYSFLSGRGDESLPRHWMS